MATLVKRACLVRCLMVAWCNTICCWSRKHVLPDSAIGHIVTLNSPWDLSFICLVHPGPSVHMNTYQSVIH